MTPYQKLQYLILSKAAKWDDEIELGEVTPENIDDLWDEYENQDSIYDATNEIRQSWDEETDIPCGEWSRHYESKSVAAKMPDGSWVGWTYWYGGGKHGEPEAIDWMESAYNIDCVEEERVVTVRTFTKREELKCTD